MRKLHLIAAVFATGVFIISIVGVITKTTPTWSLVGVPTAVLALKSWIFWFDKKR